GTKWHRKAAEQGDSRSQCYVGEYHVKGRGVQQDYIEAYKWFSLAAAQGDADAIRYRDYLISLMTQQQIDEGQRRASQFKALKEKPLTADTGTKPDSTDPLAELNLLVGMQNIKREVH